jgi:hypothetical protein
VNWEAIGAVGEIVGGLGVLASLVYLATQIRHNTRSLEAVSLQSVLDGPRDRYFLPQAANAEISDIFARGLNALDNLDATEKRRFFFLMFEQLFQMQHVMQLHERGMLAEADYEAWIKYTAALLTTPGGAALWPHAAAVITPTIRDLMNDFLERNPDHPSMIELVPLFRYDASHGEAA